MLLWVQLCRRYSSKRLICRLQYAMYGRLFYHVRCWMALEYLYAKSKHKHFITSVRLDIWWMCGRYVSSSPPRIFDNIHNQHSSDLRSDLCLSVSLFNLFLLFFSYSFNSGFSISATEYGDECYCGNSFAGGTPATAPSSDCTF